MSAYDNHANVRLLQAVRDAYWEASKEGDFDCLEDRLKETGCFGEDEAISAQQRRALFNVLPAPIIGKVIAWGLDDTVVREEISEFIEQNREMVQACLREPPAD